MANKGHITGMRGVYLVAAELTRLGFIACPTSRSALAADILVTDQSCQRTYTVQVKTNARTFGFWLVGAKARSPRSRTHMYVLVNLRSVDGQDRPEFFVVPSGVVAAKMVSTVSRTATKSNWHHFHMRDALRYRDKWSLFGDSASTPA